MSTLVTENLQDAGGSVPVATVRRGSAKAWMNFNGTGTVAIRDSENVSSITDNGTGDYNATFTDSMTSGDYNVAHGNTDTGAVVLNSQSGGLTASSARVRSFTSTTAAAVDAAGVGVTVHGDLA